MSRMRAVAAEVVRETLAASEWKEIDPVTKQPTGRTAKDLTEDELARMYQRAHRRRWSKQPMSLYDVVRASRQRHRARQTHPGKRGRL